MSSLLRRLSAHLAAACTALAITSAAAQPPPDTQGVDIGVNVGGVDDFAVESFFVDAMKQSRHWGSTASPWDESATVDAQGWPTQDAGIVVLCCVADRHGRSALPGTYALSFQGQASVSLVVYAGSVSPVQYNAATNTSTATVTLADGGAGTSLFLAFTNTQRNAAAAIGTGVTGVQLIRPQLAPDGRAWWTSPGQVFTTPYLDLLRPFSTLRFMDFTATNGVGLTSWAQRTTPSMASQQSPNGAAWEYAVQLANLTHHDMWINIPDQADDDYVTQLATLLNTTLDPSLHVYTEYSNEVWNYSFPQAGRNQAAAEAEVAADPSSPLAFGCADYDSCRYEWGERRVGLRALQIGQQFTAVYGARHAMVRPVYATQLGQTYFVSLVMSMIQQAFGPPSNYLWAIAQAPYWTGDNSVDGLTTQEELDAAAANLATLAQPEHDFAVWATNLHLHSITYEGGPGMSGTASLAAKIAANRSPAIGPLVSSAIRGAVQSGIGLYMYYNDAGSYGQYGMWGLTESLFDRQTPKLKAVRAVLADKRETLATGHAVPATIAAATPDLQDGGFIASDGSYAYFGAGTVDGYLLNVPSTRAYAVSLSVGTYYGACQATLLVDGKRVGTVAIPDTGGSLSNWTVTSPQSVVLGAGLHVLSIEAGTGQFGMQSLSVQ